MTDGGEPELGDIVRTLELRFRGEDGRTVTIRVADPKEDLTAQEVEAAMDTIIAGDVFTSTGGALMGIVGARIVARETTDILVVEE